MAVIFPNSPTFNQEVVGDNNVVYVWDGQKWKSANNVGPSLFGISSGIPPSGASNGDAWFDTESGRAYVYYITSGTAQWIDMSPTWNGTLPSGSVYPSTLSSGGPSWTASGDLTVPSALTVTSGLTVDIDSLYVDAVNNRVGIGTSSPALSLDVRGQVTCGAGLLISDMSWSKDPNQLVYTFTGNQGAGNPSDGVIALASPNANPSNSRIGSIVFGNKVSGTSVTSNSGIKAVIDSYTNTNVANAADTGGSLNFYTKQDNGTLRLGMTINSNGVTTRQYQPAFLAYAETAFTKPAGWQLIGNSITIEEYDIGSNYSTSVAGRFVAPVNGLYMFYAGGWSASGSTGHDRYAWGIKVNNTGGPKWIGGSNLSAVDTPLSAFQVVLNLTATQYVELWMYSPGSMSFGNTTHPIFWGGYLLG